MIHKTNSEEETKKLAAKFAKSLNGGELIALEGDLGAGKTAFDQGVAEALGVKSKVKSPTFTLMNEYRVDHPKIKKIIHLDFYRFQNPVQLEALALGDYNKEDTVVFVEWPDIFGMYAVTANKTIKFNFVDEKTRAIDI